MSIEIFGVGFSLYVRKVRMALVKNAIDYEHIPLIPGSEGFISSVFA